MVVLELLALDRPTSWFEKVELMHPCLLFANTAKVRRLDWRGSTIAPYFLELVKRSRVLGVGMYLNLVYTLCL